MLSFKQHSSRIATKKSKKPLQEGIALSPSDFINEFTAPQTKRSSVKVVADNDDELTTHLQVKKWGVEN